MTIDAPVETIEKMTQSLGLDEKKFVENFEKLVLYEDPHFLVIDKPAGLVSEVNPPNPEYPYSLSDLSSFARGGQEEFFMVHRLDKDTSGVLIMAKTQESQGAMQRLFRLREITKEYLALVEGEWDPRTLGVKAPLIRQSPVKVDFTYPQARDAETLFKKAVVFKNGGQSQSLLRIQILTGRTHQIRAHLRYLGYPLIGDQLYGQASGLGRQFLHAYRVEFVHPFTHKRVVLRSPLPADLRDYLASKKPVQGIDLYNKFVS